MATNRQAAGSKGFGNCQHGYTRAVRPETRDQNDQVRKIANRFANLALVMAVLAFPILVVILAV